jgi:hypothetical protein
MKNPKFIREMANDSETCDAPIALTCRTSALCFTQIKPSPVDRRGKALMVLESTPESFDSKKFRIGSLDPPRRNVFWNCFVGDIVLVHKTDGIILSTERYDRTFVCLFIAYNDVKIRVADFNDPEST